ncbi:amino acid ABC transporter permease [Jatrophihabitans sp. DSM 45814]
MDLAALLKAGIVTLELTVGSWLFAVVLGVLLAVLRHLGGPLVAAIVTVYVAVSRALPQLVFLYLIYFGLPEVNINLPSKLAAIVGLGMTEAGFIAEYFRSGIITVAGMQEEAGTSIGFGRLTTFRIIVFPQAAVVALPALINSFIGLLKLATLASALGAPEILYEGTLQISRTGRVGAIATVLIGVYVVFTYPAIRLVGRLESKVARWTLNSA